MNQSVALVFDGKTFDAEKDGPRLTSEFEAVKRIMHDGRWHTLYELRLRVEAKLKAKVSEAGISARVRDLRKTKFGGYTVERRRGEFGGTHEYRMIVQHELPLGEYVESQNNRDAPAVSVGRGIGGLARSCAA